MYDKPDCGKRLDRLWVGLVLADVDEIFVLATSHTIVNG